MEWIKASEKLPQNSGELNRVIIRSSGFGKDIFGHEYGYPFVTYGYKNFSEEDPKFYFTIAGESFLTNENIEWLDETQPLPSGNVEEAAKEYASSIFDASFKGEFQVRTDSFLAGAAWQASQSSGSKEEWRRVEDGLPELRKPVLVYMNYGKQDTCYWTGELWVQSVRAEHSNGGITHWMPLPAPPQQ